MEKKIEKKLQSIKTTDLSRAKNLVKTLENNGGLHSNYYHHTNLSSVVSMAQSEKFHLSLGDRMNDSGELQKGSRELWDRIYVGSFNFGDNENMGLWGLYSLPWQDGVRIDIPKTAMIGWIEQLKNSPKIYEVNWNSDKNAYEYTPIDCHFEVGLTDVVYANKIKSSDKDKNRNKVLRLKNNGNVKLCDYRIDREEDITGYIKDSVWEYENEVRIRLVTERALKSNQIAIDFPENIFSQITIWACPWFRGDIQDRIEEEITFPFKNERQSSFSRLADNMKNSCSMCAHGEFKSKYD